MLEFDVERSIFLVSLNPRMRDELSHWTFLIVRIPGLEIFQSLFGWVLDNRLPMPMARPGDTLVSSAESPCVVMSVGNSDI